MASFPTSVFSPSARSNGQVIDASHVNDLQGEVTAIEDGFRNATAPLNSSGSTLASLSVTGNTTLAALNAGASTLASLSVTGGSTFGAITLGASSLASLSVTGNSTVAALNAGAATLASLSVTGNSTLAALQGGASTVTSLSVSGASTFAVRPVEPPPDVAKVTRQTALDLVSNTTLAIAWTTQEILTNSSMHSTGTNPSQLSPQSTGVYVISACVRLSAAQTSTGSLMCVIEDSSATELGRGGARAFETVISGAMVGSVKRFDALGGWVRVVAQVRDGSTMSVAVAGSHCALYKL